MATILLDFCILYLETIPFRYRNPIEMKTRSVKNEPLFPGYDLATIRLLHSSKFRKSVKNSFFTPHS